MKSRSMIHLVEHKALLQKRNNEFFRFMSPHHISPNQSPWLSGSLEGHKVSHLHFGQTGTLLYQMIAGMKFSE